MNDKIYFATDHAGFELKNVILEYVRDELSLPVEDMGAYQSELGDDYPDYIVKAAREVSENPEARAIIFGGSGQGEAMVANRFPHVRATVYYGGEPEIITLSREHNNANVLSLGARFLNRVEAKQVVKEWLSLGYDSSSRHQQRNEKIDELTK
ncbi:RpiB/LacA/LacB family sugar-phosphate isomerase [Candidatus Kaiserbacteria bacterium]|nr:RpiB/LacA/LacB family sugar-phosphate isomerase [Candidatus Kaiserbacteria bacterium]